MVTTGVLLDLKAHLDITHDDNDPELYDVAEVAEAVVRRVITDKAWAERPPDVAYAVLLVARRLWETQRGRIPSAVGIGDDSPPSLALPLLPPLAATLLAPYQQHRPRFSVGSIRIQPGLA